MLIVYDSKNKAYELTEQIGRGGEGTVFACPHDPALVAKIYHEPIDDEKAAKLRWMAEHTSEQILKVAAWVVDTLTDAPGGKTIGFLMPNVKAKEIHELYSLKSRRVYFPDATWTFLVHTAANVARAFYVLHKNEHVMGDVNHGNCVVLADGTVKLIDCDSYSTSRDGRRDRCEVGVATHLAPELQGKDLSRIERVPAHDNFGLAVIIFQLLFLGRHPFAGRYLGDEEKSLEDCIRERRFAYSPDAHRWQVRQPPGTLSLAKVSPRLAAMFERAFLTEDRPAPREWVEALEDLSASLQQCSMHIGHYYFRELAACPWCEIEGQTGLMLFPFVSHNPADREENFNIFTVENLLTSLSVPQKLPAKLPKKAVSVEPSPAARVIKRRRQRQWAFYSVGQIVFIVTVMAIFGPGAAFFLGVILMIAFLVISSDGGRSVKNELEEKLERANSEWAQIENEWTKLTAAGLDDEVARLRQKIADYQGFQKQSIEQKKRLENEAAAYELNRHLASFPIKQAQLPGLKAAQIGLLENLCIRTAADVDAKNLETLSPMVREIAPRLVEWRRELENGFETAPAKVPETALKRLESDFSARRRQIEREIETMFGGLRARSTHLAQRHDFLRDKSEQIGRHLRQTEADANAVGGLAPLAVSLVLVTTLLPIFGVALQTPKMRYEAPSVDGAPRISSAPLAHGTGIQTDRLGSVSGTTDEKMLRELTDEAIAAMPERRREEMAMQLHNEAVNSGFGKDDFAAAERKMRIAVKLAPQQVYLQNHLGDVLYERKKYDESLAVFKKALEIDPQNEDAKISVGRNYIKMKRSDKAVGLLLQVLGENSFSFKASFNLGLAYMELKDYKSANIYFSKALSLKPNDAETLYQYGLSLSRTGLPNLAEEQYEKLLDLDVDKAEQLRKMAPINVPPPPKAPKQGSYYDIK